MIPFQAMIAAQHLDDLRREATASRRAREAQVAFRGPGRPNQPEPRRLLARVALALSRVASETARRLDPGFDSSDQPIDALGSHDAFRRRPILGHHEAFAGR